MEIGCHGLLVRATSGQDSDTFLGTRIGAKWSKARKAGELGAWERWASDAIRICRLMEATNGSLAYLYPVCRSHAIQCETGSRGD